MSGKPKMSKTSKDFSLIPDDLIRIVEQSSSQRIDQRKEKRMLKEIAPYLRHLVTKAVKDAAQVIQPYRTILKKAKSNPSKSEQRNIIRSLIKDYKGDEKEIVSLADCEIQTQIIRSLSSKFPFLKILAAEEDLTASQDESSRQRRESRWGVVIDPIDGTHAFLNLHKFYGISVTVLYCNREGKQCVVASALFAPEWITEVGGIEQSPGVIFGRQWGEREAYLEAGEKRYPLQIEPGIDQRYPKGNWCMVHGSLEKIRNSPEKFAPCFAGVHKSILSIQLSLVGMLYWASNIPDKVRIKGLRTEGTLNKNKTIRFLSSDFLEENTPIRDFVYYHPPRGQGGKNITPWDWILFLGLIELYPEHFLVIHKEKFTINYLLENQQGIEPPLICGVKEFAEKLGHL